MPEKVLTKDEMLEVGRRILPRVHWSKTATRTHPRKQLAGVVAGIAVGVVQTKTGWRAEVDAVEGFAHVATLEQGVETIRKLLELLQQTLAYSLTKEV